MNCVLKEEIKQLIKDIYKDAKKIDYTVKYKQKSYNPLKYMKKLLPDIVSGSNKEISLSDILNGKTYISFKEMIDDLPLIDQSTLSTFNDELIVNQLLHNQNNLIKTIDNDSIIRYGLGLNEILEALPEYINKAKKAYGEDYKNYIYTGLNNNNIVLNYESIAYLIGRQVYEKQGLILKSPKRIEIFKSIGYEVLNHLEEQGFITVEPEGKIPTFDYINASTGSKFRSFNNEGELFVDGKIFTINRDNLPSNISDLLNGQQIEYNNKTFDSIYDYYNYLKTYIQLDNMNATETDIKQYISDDITDKDSFIKEIQILNQLSVAKKINNFFTPSNYANVFINKEDIDPTIKKDLRYEQSAIDIDNVKSIKEFVDDIEDKPYYIHKDFLTLFNIITKQWKQFVEERKSENKSFSIESFLYDENNRWLIKAFKLDYDSGIEELKQSDAGKYKTRKQALFNILQEMLTQGDNWNGQFYKLLFRGSNSRLYNALITLNADSDKVLTRHIIKHSKEPRTIQFKLNNKLTSEASSLLTNIVEGLPKSIQNEIESSKQQFIDSLEEPTKLKEYLNSIIKDNDLKSIIFTLLNDDITNKLTYKQLEALGSYINNNDNLTSIITSINALKELINTLKDNKFKTTYDIEQDASSSGITINVFQEIGNNNNKIPEQYAKQMGMLNTNKVSIKGFYELVMKKLDDYLQTDNKEKDFTKLSFETLTDKQDIQYFKQHPEQKQTAINLWNYLTKELKLNARDLVKPPTMTVGNYSQSVYNAAKGEVSESIVLKLLEKIYNNNEININIFKQFIEQFKDNTGSDNKQLIDEVFGINNNLLEILDDNSKLKTFIKNNIINAADGVTKLKTLITNNISRMLSEVAYNTLQKDLFKDTTEQLTSIFDQVTKLFGLNPQIKSDPDLFYMADIPKVYDNVKEGMNIIEATKKAITDNITDNGRIKSKTLQPLLSERETLDKNTLTTRSIKIPNKYTLLVSTTHSLDTTILVNSVNLAKEKIISIYGEDEFKNMNVTTIHDAILTNPKYEQIYEQSYKQVFKDTMSKLDKSLIYYQSLKTILEHKINTKQIEPRTVHNLLSKLDKLINNRLEILNNRQQILEQHMDIGSLKGKIFEADKIFEYSKLSSIDNKIREELSKQLDISKFNNMNELIEYVRNNSSKLNILKNKKLLQLLSEYEIKECK